MNEIIEHDNIASVKKILEFDYLVDAFVDSQDTRLNSKLLYKRTLKQYSNWIILKNYNLSEITRTHILEYKSELLASNKSSLTVGSYITSVRCFYEWLEANGFYVNVAKGIKNPKRKNQFKKQPLLPHQASALLNYFEDKLKRDYAIINLLLRTGLRTVEIIRATVDDIVIKGSKRVLLVQGKGRDEKDDFVLLTDKTHKTITDYLDTRVIIDKNEPLFISLSNNSYGKKLSTRTISFIVKEGLKAIGLDDKSFTAHSLRHTTAVSILRAGGTLETVQFTLRHSNPATTQIYTATLNEERRLNNAGETLIDGVY
jgi:integrase/recombinase XerD